MEKSPGFPVYRNKEVMKKIISTVLFILLCFWAAESAIAAAADLPGKDWVLDCFQKAKKIIEWDWDGAIKEISWIPNPLNTSKNLVCKWSTLENTLYQATIDVLFTQIDLKVEKYLKTLVWTKNPMASLNDLQKKFWISWEAWSFDQMYSHACGKWARDYMLSLTNISHENITFKPNCEVVYKLKLQSYYDAWEVIIARETEKSYQKSKKTFMSSIKDKYRDLLFKLTVYLGQLKVMDAKWYTNTKNPWK
ncbi:MAG: hypothetical protein ACD_2C00258G0018 [uncultured bacterium (gcode 4)]|uniref:Uncharacterized protein n=1 Tax=uncultured bacterium (gcode 4) TaxID=1234023 RepID=K2G167_9BACT|nr:MAG: hypothetical protein ACD_2C00258G0018 [uncultured bacterium (gcode 4)]